MPSRVVQAESYGSESIVTRPLNAGSKRSLMECSSRPVFFGLYPRPTAPDCQGILKTRFLSYGTDFRLSTRLLTTLGMFFLSSGSTQRLRTHLLAMGSVST